MNKKVQELLSQNKKQCLYMFEILINHLNLNLESTINEFDNKNSYLIINLTFLDLPVFTINENNINLSKKYRKSKLDIGDFSAAGVSCVFSKRPKNFFEMIKGKESLKISIYRTDMCKNCLDINDEVDYTPVCQTTIHFDECLCDQFNMAINNHENLPESFEKKEKYELLNRIGNKCGSIELFIRISCYGTSIITRFCHNEKSFIFKNFNSTDEFECSKLLSAKEIYLDFDDRIPEAKTVVGVSKLCQDLPKKYHNLNITSSNRMRGGGLSNENINLPMFPIQSMQTLLSGACKTNNENNDKPGCGCYGVSGLGVIKMNHGCSNKPCHGIDCLIRAFKRTQEFVDNIKVTGMSGLGLMDPTESPYFGRNRDKQLPTTCSERKSHDESQLNHSNEINTLFDISKHRNVTNSISKKTKPDEKSLQNHQELNNQKDKILDNDWCGEDLRKLEKNHKNIVKDISENKTISDQVNQQIIGFNKPEITRIKRKRRNRRVKKFCSESRQRFYSRNYIKPSKQIMRLVRAVASRLHFGHKSCVDIRIRVPGNMGWLWNTRNTAGEPKPQIGWKPGAITREVWRLLEDAKTKKTDEVPVDRPITPIKGKKSKSSRKRNTFLLSKSQGEREGEHELSPPTLHIRCKKNKYDITVKPIKKEFFNQPELQENVSLQRFTVYRNKDDSSSSSTELDMKVAYSPSAALIHPSTKISTKNFTAQVNTPEIIESINDTTQVIKSKRRRAKTNHRSKKTPF